MDGPAEAVDERDGSYRVSLDVAIDADWTATEDHTEPPWVEIVSTLAAKSLSDDGTEVTAERVGFDFEDAWRRLGESDVTDGPVHARAVLSVLVSEGVMTWDEDAGFVVPIASTDGSRDGRTLFNCAAVAEGAVDHLADQTARVGALYEELDGVESDRLARHPSFDELRTRFDDLRTTVERFDVLTRAAVVDGVGSSADAGSIEVPEIEQPSLDEVDGDELATVLGDLISDYEFLQHVAESYAAELRARAVRQGLSPSKTRAALGEFAGYRGDVGSDGERTDEEFLEAFLDDEADAEDSLDRPE